MEYKEIKPKDIKGNYKVKIDLRKLKGSTPIEQSCHCGCECGFECGVEGH